MKKAAKAKERRRSRFRGKGGRQRCGPACRVGGERDGGCKGAPSSQQQQRTLSSSLTAGRPRSAASDGAGARPRREVGAQGTFFPGHSLFRRPSGLPCQQQQVQTEVQSVARGRPPRPTPPCWGGWGRGLRGAQGQSPVETPGEKMLLAWWQKRHTLTALCAGSVVISYSDRVSPPPPSRPQNEGRD